ncbi:hypothetical protein VTK26DRAFT_770 [Humicola hyalothermophila]
MQGDEGTFGGSSLVTIHHSSSTPPSFPSACLRVPSSGFDARLRAHWTSFAGLLCWSVWLVACVDVGFLCEEALANEWVTCACNRCSRLGISNTMHSFILFSLLPSVRWAFCGRTWGMMETDKEQSRTARGSSGAVGCSEPEGASRPAPLPLHHRESSNLDQGQGQGQGL